MTGLLLTVPGCGGGATPPPPHPVSPITPAAASTLATGCTADLLSGYRLDAAHSGRLTAHNYSAAADVQAALEYDQLRAGSRDVFLRRAAAGRVTGVASCVAMQFPTAHLAARFFMSYRALRKEAGSLVERIPIGSAAGGLAGATGYLEREQSFRGYRISSTDVVEYSGRDGARLDIVSVAGTPPPRSLAAQLLAAMAEEK